MKGFILVISCLFVCVGHAQAQKVKHLNLKASSVELKKIADMNLQKAQNMAGGSSLAEQDLVIQFQGAVTEENKRDLEAQGFRVLQYLPEDALIVRGVFLKALDFQSSRPDIYAVAPYMSEWKLSSDFHRVSVLDQKNNVLVHIRILPRTDLKKVIEKISSEDEVLGARGRDILLRTTKLKTLALSEQLGVEYIQLAPEISTFDFSAEQLGEDTERDDSLGETKTGYESGTRVMNFDAAWSRGFTGQSQVVAMADTGLDSGVVSTLHKDLTTVLGGEPVGLFGESWEDPQGHGTHVTGSVVGRGVMSQGLIRGGAYDAGYFAQGMWSPLMNNISVPYDLKGMFQSASNHGARIHTNSWGAVSNLGAYDNMSASVDEFMFNNQDLLVIFAAGNSGVDMNQDGVIDPGSVSSPGTAKNALTVGASENYMMEGGRQKACGEMREGDKKWGVSPLKTDKLSNDSNGIACFSSRGPTSDSRIKPDIVAPGTNIVSLRSKHPKATRLWGIYNEEYSWAGGTSMATPLTAGAAAVTRQYLISKGLESPSAAMVKATLLHTATDLFPGQFGLGQGQEIPTQRPNSVEGYGRVNMDAVTNLNSHVQIHDERSGIATGESLEYSLSLQGKRGHKNSKGLRATLVYTDAPAAASAAQTLVNNLDLSVVSPDGTVYAKADSINNTEMIEVMGGSTGNYKVIVKGMNVPQGQSGKQPFALIISPIY